MNVVNNVDMSSLRAPWQNGPYTEKHTEQHEAPRGNILFLDSEENLFLYYSKTTNVCSWEFRPNAPYKASSNITLQ